MNDYTTKTASLLAAKIKGSKADVTYLNIDGAPFSKVVSDNVPESPTNKDLWKYAVTTDKNGVVTITDDVTVDYSEMTINQWLTTRKTAKVINNKVLDANDTLLMNWDTKNFTNKRNSTMNIVFNGSLSQKATITEWDSDLSSLTNGQRMFFKTTLQSFSGDLSSLIRGGDMFYDTELTEWTVNLPSLIYGGAMFYSTPITSWNIDLPNLIDGHGMFNGTSLTSWNIDLPSLIYGESMFRSCTGLTSFSGDMSNLIDGEYMFYGAALTSFNGDLSSLSNGYRVFYSTALTSFNGDLSSLISGGGMFYGTSLTSWNIDLPSLIYGETMFRNTTLTSFNGDLSSLSDGTNMFYSTALTSFNGDLSSLSDGSAMFYSTALTSFNGDLSSLTDGYGMFQRNHPRHYGVSHLKMVDGEKTQVTETFVSNGLKSFISNLSSLKCGYRMFGTGDDITYTYTDDNGNEVTETTKDVVPLDEKSIMFIADTINDISSLDKTVDSDWSYTAYNYKGNLITHKISSSYRGILHLGYDATTITDTSKIMKYCDKIANKGWTVYLNGSLQTANNGAIETIPLTDENGSPIVIPHYYKPVQVTDEEIAEYVDANNNYYIIIGGQHVFGDDISTYGMFTSYEHAVSEITTGLGLTKYEKPSTENSDNN